MNDSSAITDLAPSDDASARIVGGGIPIQATIPTPVLVGQSVNTTMSGLVALGHINVNV